MKLLNRDEHEFEFEFELPEKGLLFHLLGLYPAVPADYHRLARGKKKLPDGAEKQQMLDEALAAQRDANRREIATLLQQSGRFTDAGQTSRAWFQRHELEWLLQVLNDVRIGNWIALGSPKWEPGERPTVEKEFLHHLMLMEIAGGFEMFILGALDGSLTPEDDQS